MINKLTDNRLLSINESFKEIENVLFEKEFLNWLSKNFNKKNEKSYLIEASHIEIMTRSGKINAIYVHLEERYCLNHFEDRIFCPIENIKDLSEDLNDFHVLLKDVNLMDRQSVNRFKVEIKKIEEFLNIEIQFFNF